MVKAKVWKQIRPFDGLPERSDFELVEENLRPIEDGEFLVKAMYLSVDPCTAGPHIDKNNNTTRQTQIARIIQSKNEDFPEGKLVVVRSSWRTYSIVDGTVDPAIPEPYLLPNMGGLCPSVALGMLGVPGNIAYFTFLELCDPKKGETVVVSGAASLVGSIVCQIAKIKECTVIGIVETDDEGKWLKDLGIDHFINRNNQDVDKELTGIAKQGVDCYFDNVGGKVSAVVCEHMNTEGRIAKSKNMLYKSTANDNAGNEEAQKIIEKKNLKLKEMDVYSRTIQWMAGMFQLQTWMAHGRIKFKQSIGEGFENTINFFIAMSKGDSSGKPVVQVFQNLECH
ncbi:prostaglandin reductase 1-like [Diabrotica virgifera virgifera]|uniref:15-oxoprostaglandin 13-reductase n=1 Tax=Diabrotica virgifera virgifera TaxID=50390 RepID=A0A6P7F6A0_DIAVI|nr:prostaglandin reductase 1-like [Diabrotica virgifera virgifera]